MIFVLLLRRCIYWLISSLYLLLASQHALSLSPIQLSSTEQAYPITHQLTYLVDPDGILTAQQVLNSGDLEWQNHESESPNFGITSDVYWWRFSIKNTLDYNDWLLVMHYPLLDQVDLFIKLEDGEQSVTQYRFGDIFDFDDRAIAHRQFLTKLDIPKGTAATIYLRIASQSTIQGPMTIWPHTLFFSNDQTSIVKQGFYYGGMLIMSLFNLIIFIMIRDKNYLFFATFVIFQTLFQAGVHGFGFQYIWPNFPKFQQISSILSLNISMGFAGLFFDDLMRLKHYNRKASILIRCTAIFLLLQAVTILFVPYIWALRVSILSVAFLSISSVIITAPLYSKNIIEAKFVIFGWGVMIVGSLLLALEKYGVIEQNNITSNAFQIGSIIQVLLLSAAIANRINTERRQLLLSEQTSLKLERDAKETLEKKVLERTRELERLNQKLNTLSRTDALTNLLNRRAFDEIYQNETEYCREHEIPLAILVLDIDHFKRINDNYGHETGDKCLRFVGQQLKGELDREHVHLARYGGEEFVIIMRGIDQSNAMKQAEELRKNIQNSHIHIGENTINITASIGVASDIPQQRGETRLFHLADKALYKSKNNGRNQVRLSYS